MFSIKRPLATHWREAVCGEVDCPHHLLGWATLVDEATAFGQRQAGYIRYQSGRRFREERQETGLTRFVFGPGQRCFREHKLPEKPPVLSRDGALLPADQWIDEFNENSYRINQQRKRG